MAPGVVLQEVSHNGEAERAGLREGDIVLAWSRNQDQGKANSPFDLAEVEIEQSQLGTVKLEGFRGTESRVWSLGPNHWEVRARPNFTGSSLIFYRKGQELAKSANSTGEGASDPWKELADRCSASPSLWLRAWLFFDAAELLGGAKRWAEADEAFRSAVRWAPRADGIVKAEILQAWAGAYRQRGDWANAEKYFQQAAATGAASDRTQLAIALSLDELGNISRERGESGKADEYYRHALEIREKLAPDSLAAASSLNGLGTTAAQRGDLVKADEYYRHALKICQKLAPDSVAAASTLNGLGNTALQRGDLATADEYFRQSLELREKLAPGSLDFAASLNNIGAIAWGRGDLDNAEQYYRRALEIRQNLAPKSLDVGASLNNLGVLASRRGDLAKAELYLRESLEIAESLAPASQLAASDLVNFGTVMKQRGNLATAEESYRRALDILKKLGPDTNTVASVLNNLGTVATIRGDLPTAEEYFRTALDIHKKRAPQSLSEVASLTNLGDVARLEGERAKAEQYIRQALEIEEKLGPGSLDVASVLDTLAPIALERGDIEEARQYYRQALDIEEKLAPESLPTVETLEGLGNLARKAGSPGEAEAYYRRALDVENKLGQGTIEHAELLASEASILSDRHELDEATELYAQAVSVLEKQTASLGGSEEVRSSFRASHSEIYKHYVDLLLEKNEPDRALEVLERSRARILLEMLVAARIDVRKGADPSLLEQERSIREALAAKSNRRLELLTEKDKIAEGRLAALTRELESLEQKYQDVEQRLERNSPAYAALTQPQPMTAREIQQLLDPGTVLLEYTLGEKRSHVFAVTRDSITVRELAPRAEIESQARQLYNSLTARTRPLHGENGDARDLLIAKSDADYFRAASTLSRLLIAPLISDLGQKRLVLVADGILQYVPFAALPLPHNPHGSGSAGDRVSLIEQHEIVELPSASVLALLRKERASRHAAPKQLAVLADPVFDADDQRVMPGAGKASPAQVSKAPPTTPGADLTGDLTRSLADQDASRGGAFHLARLLFSRREAAAIMAPIPPGMGLEALDFDASRKLATSGDLAGYRIVHFATHALIDSQRPELSGLVLSLVDEKGNPQDGFLDLHDVYNLDLAADLVVLSACETALGKQVDGEGMIGLTRGFMYAGAGGVVGTRWKVDDAATAQFMKTFYSAIEKDRLSAAQALRRAQLALRKEKRWSFPFYWSGFMLQGDWK